MRFCVAFPILHAVGGSVIIGQDLRQKKLADMATRFKIPFPVTPVQAGFETLLSPKQTGAVHVYLACLSRVAILFGSDYLRWFDSGIYFRKKMSFLRGKLQNMVGSAFLFLHFLSRYLRR